MEDLYARRTVRLSIDPRVMKREKRDALFAKKNAVACASVSRGCLRLVDGWIERKMAGAEGSRVTYRTSQCSRTAVKKERRRGWWGAGDAGDDRGGH